METVAEAERRIRSSVSETASSWSDKHADLEVWYDDSEGCFGRRPWRGGVSGPGIGESVQISFDPIKASEDPSYLEGLLDEASEGLGRDF